MDERVLSYVLRSGYRKKILKLLGEQPQTAIQVKKKTGMYESHVSRAVKELREAELIYCKNPKDRRFKFYQITLKGKSLLQDVKKVEE